MRTVSQTFTSAQAGTVLAAIAANQRVFIDSVILTAHGSNTGNTSMKLSIGPNQILHHPGVTGGGGLVATGLKLGTGIPGDDIVFDCGDPTGGSVSVSVTFWVQ